MITEITQEGPSYRKTEREISNSGNLGSNINTLDTQTSFSQGRVYDGKTMCHFDIKSQQEKIRFLDSLIMN